MLTWLTAQGLPDAAIQLISGHASKKSLEVCQHLSVAQVEPGYQRAVKGWRFDGMLNLATPASTSRRERVPHVRLTLTQTNHPPARACE